MRSPWTVGGSLFILGTDVTHCWSHWVKTWTRDWMNRELVDLYSDYLLSSFGATTATGLSELLEGTLSHDQITRFLSQQRFDSKTLWQLVKPMMRAIEDDAGVLIFDDTIEEKPYTDENELISWHFDHSKNRTVKGINLLKGISNNTHFHLV